MPADLKRVMSRFASGVTVATARYRGVDHAMTATAFTSVSLEPPLVLVCVAKTARFHPAVLGAGKWAISLLAADQASLARHFSSSGRDLSTQFDQVPHEVSALSGAPWISAALGWMDCETYAAHDGGDHTIVVGRVLRTADEPASERPLTYYQGTYGAA